MSPKLTVPDVSSSALDSRDFTRAMDGFCGTGTSSGSSSDTGEPKGGLPMPGMRSLPPGLPGGCHFTVGIGEIAVCTVCFPVWL